MLLSLSSINFVGHGISMDDKFPIHQIQIDFNDLIYQLLGSANFSEDGGEQLALDLRSHSVGSIDTDESGVKWNIRILPGGSWIVGVTAKSTLFRVTKVQPAFRIKGFSSQSFQPAFPIQTT
jgi:hypothetical protein